MTSDYKKLRESIRTNGLAYTARISAEAGNIWAMRTIDALFNQCIKPTDWLAMRARWVKYEPNAIRLTTTIKE